MICQILVFFYNVVWTKEVPKQKREEVVAKRKFKGNSLN